MLSEIIRSVFSLPTKEESQAIILASKKLQEEKDKAEMAYDLKFYGAVAVFFISLAVVIVQFN